MHVGDPPNQVPSARTKSETALKVKHLQHGAFKLFFPKYVLSYVARVIMWSDMNNNWTHNMLSDYNLASIHVLSPWWCLWFALWSLGPKYPAHFSSACSLIFQWTSHLCTECTLPSCTSHLCVLVTDSGTGAWSPYTKKWEIFYISSCRHICSFNLS